MPHINLEHKTDRDILVILVEQVNGLTERLDKINGSCSGHEKRLCEMEAWRSKVLGALSVMVIAIPAISALLVKLIT